MASTKLSVYLFIACFHLLTIRRPLRVRVDIRDHFDAPECSVQKAFGLLGGIIGLKTQCNVEWEQLFHALEPLFEDKATFVPSIADAVITWCDVLSTRLDDDNFATWTDELTGKLGEIGLITIYLQITEESRPTTIWSSTRRGFVVSFPQKTEFSSRNASFGFESDFQDLFRQSETSPKQEECLPIRSREDEWAEITEASESASVGMDPVLAIRTVESEKIRNVATIPSLDIFLKTTTPYILLITQKGSGRIVESGSSSVFDAGAGRSMGQGSTTWTQQGGSTLVIQGTHSASLQLLEQYLQRWVKKDHQDTRKPPVLRIKLRESNFGIGMCHDMLTIEPYDTYQEKRGVFMNPAIVLLVVENILGYHCVSRVTAGYWEYRRDTPFE